MQTNDVLTQNVHSFNVGSSDYSKHNIQPWDIWEEYDLNPWEADIVKRILRNKGNRIEDLQKIIHICRKLIELEVKKQDVAVDGIVPSEQIVSEDYNAVKMAEAATMAPQEVERIANFVNGPGADDIPDDATMNAAKPIVDEPSVEDMAYVKKVMNPDCQ